ncbi:MAG: hypothetical protein NTV49_13010 [Kiritimatiellaeota bacterium]|nr:hypothetical protein [Kiritimatiellota bacterium]
MMKKCLTILLVLFTVWLSAQAQERDASAALQLALDKITSEPFKIRWPSSKPPSVGTNLLGFIVVDVHEGTESYMTPEGQIAKRACTVAILKRGERTLELFMGRQLFFYDWFAVLRSKADGTTFKTRVGDTFAFSNRAFRLIAVDTQAVTCVVGDTVSGEKTTIVSKK